jgi:sulfate transport system ATP-binding protein
MAIEIRNVSKTFGRFTALKDVSFEVPSGELVALLGPSGGGKTTMLRIIAGLDTADSGTVLLEGEDASDRSARDRAVGFVFQHYALFRHMSVFENVAFGLRVRPRNRRPSPMKSIAKCATYRARPARLSATAFRHNSRAARGSVSHWPVLWRSSRKCSCSTSRSAHSTPTSGASCGAGCAASTTRFT